MSDRRLDPDQLRARLQANLAAATPRGQALPGAFPVDLAERGNDTLLAAPALAFDVAVLEPAPSATDDAAGPIAAPRAVKRRSGSNNGAVLSATRAGKPVVHRCDSGAVLRGYRIPLDLHRQAERAKLRASAHRGATLFWDEVLQAAIDAIPDDIGPMAEGLAAARGAGRAEPNPTTRVLQATIRHDQELKLRTLRLDIEEALDRTVRLEEIWTWMVREVVEGRLTFL